MKNPINPYIYVLLLSAVSTLNSPSFGQNIPPDILEPGAVPKYFLQDGVKAPNKQSGPAFTADGKTLYLSDNDTIKVSLWEGGKWTRPVTVNFSGKWHDWDPVLSADGKILVFVSNRPPTDEPQDKAQKYNQLWMTELISGTNWSAPKYMDPNINPTGVSSYGPSIGKKLTLYFSAIGRDGTKIPHAYYSNWLGDHYDTAVQLSLNGEKDVLDPFISADERYIVFKSGFDLYICYRQGKQWSAARKLGAQVNNGGYNTVPRVSVDGKTLYYSSSNASGILMIPVKIPKL